MRLRDPKLWLALVSLAAVVVLVTFESQSTSPGPLTATHAQDVELEGSSGCDRCHGSGEGSMAQACATCHEEIGQQLTRKQGFHGALRGVDASACGPCHLEHHGDDVALVDQHAFAKAGVAALEEFRHDFTAYHLTGVHASLACEKCHPKARAAVLAKGEQRFLGLAQACTACHADPHEGRFVASCESCHGQEHPWKELANFVHISELPLTGGHARIECARCHEKGSPHSVEALGGAAPKPVARACQDCHESPHAARFVLAVARELELESKASCVACHAPQQTTFKVPGSAMTPSLHAATGFALDKPHDAVACERCHASYGTDQAFAERYPGRDARDCGACHADPHAGQFVADGGVPVACIQCHAREAFEPHAFDVAAHARTAFPLDGSHVRVECDACHVKQGTAPRTFRGTPARCEQCHADVHSRLFDTPMGALALRDDSRGSCAICHGTTRFSDTRDTFGAPEHAQSTGFVLRAAHERAQCEACHTRAAEPDSQGRRFGRVAELFGTPVTECATCHEDVHRGAFERSELRRVVDGRATCGRCHSEERFKELPLGFDHGVWTGFALDGAHQRAECVTCHGRAPELSAPRRELGFVGDKFPGPSELCATCHADAHRGAFDAAHLPAQVSGAASCARCHSTESFAASARESFDHAQWTKYPLEGRHARAACEACHLPLAEPDELGRRFGRASGSTCADCHADPHAAQFSDRACESCHASSKSFGDLRFDHTRDSRFPLDERHAHLDCAVCHQPWPLADGRRVVRYKPLGLTCVECHGFGKGGGR